MERQFSQIGDQEHFLVMAVALLEAGHIQEALSVLEQGITPEQDGVSSRYSLEISLARSIRTHALADPGQGKHALACLEEALALDDPESCLMAHLRHIVSTGCSGAADRSLPASLPASLQDLLATLSPEASGHCEPDQIDARLSTLYNTVNERGFMIGKRREYLHFHA